MAFTLGFAPEKFDVDVSAGADFYSSLRRKDGTDWAATAQVILDFGVGINPWVATLTGPVATWDIDQAVVDAVIAAKPKKVRLWYVDGGTRLLWGSGALKQVG